jgi:O-antigen ligase
LLPDGVNIQGVAVLHNYSINWAVAAFVLLYEFAPNAYGGFYLTLALMVSFAGGFLLLKSIKTMRFNGILLLPGPLFLLMSLLLLSFSITLTLNASFFTTIGLSEMAKPLIFSLFFVFGVSANLQYALPEIKKTLLLVAKIVLVGQFILVVDQVLDIRAFSVVYDYGKTSSTGELTTFMRSTGSKYNPNDFAWVVMQYAIVIFLFSRKMTRYFWLFLALLMIMLSGSKSLIALFPTALFLAGWLRGERLLLSRKNLLVLLAVTSLGISVYKFLEAHPDIFPRLDVLMTLLSGDDEGFESRYKIWETGYAYFLTKESGFLTWLFGLGPIEEFKVLDNGYIYTFLRDGIVGLVLHVSMIFYFLYIFFKFRDRELGALAFQYVFIAGLHEIVVEGLAGWQDPVRLFLYAGLVYSYEYRRQRGFAQRLTQDKGSPSGRVSVMPSTG